MRHEKQRQDESMPRRAVSYDRVSQAKMGGDSLDRQADFAKEISDKHAWLLDDTFRFTDKSRSAFKRKNRTPTADLTRFLRAIEGGDITPGTVLIIERIDRLTRDKIAEAQKLWLSILDAGVWIATKCPERIYAGPPEDLMDLLEPLFLMYLAHEESQKKSLCATRQWKKAREAARDNKEPLPTPPPTWIGRVEGKWVLKADLVEDLHRLADLVELHGTGTVAAMMETERRTGLTRKGHWSGSAIRKLLSKRTLLGEYQPRRWVNGEPVEDGPPIEGFYPPVLKPDKFNAVQAALRRRRQGSGRPATRGRVNVLRGLVVDLVSERQMAMQTTAAGTSYLTIGGLSGCTRCPYLDVLDCVLDTVRQLRPADVLPSDQVQTAQEQLAAELKARIAALRLKQAALQEALPDPKQDTVSILTALAAVKDDLARTSEEHKKAHWHARSGRADALVTAQTLVELRAEKSGDVLIDLDNRIQAALPTVIRRIDLSVERLHRKARVITLAIHLLNGQTRSVVLDPRVQP